MRGTFLFLGTGASMGTPVVTCQCAVCKSQDRRNQRLRPSGLLKVDNRQILFDAGPDFREQALRYGVSHLDGVILTHLHYDHSAGLDDLRVFYFLKHQTLPCLLSHAAYQELKIRTPYFFEKNREKISDDVPDDMMGGPQLQFQVMDENISEVQFCAFSWRVVFYEQNQMQVTGYRIGNFAYVMDLKHYPETIFSCLKGVEILVLSGLRKRPSPAHLTLDEALDFAKKVGAVQTWFSHVSHELDHETTNEWLPPTAKLAYDGLEISIYTDSS